MTALLHLHGDEPGFGTAFPSLYNVVYCSRAAADVDEATVQRIDMAIAELKRSGVVQQLRRQALGPDAAREESAAF
jgi:hypothetical protein